MKSSGQLVLKLDMRWLFAAPAMPLTAISASVPHAACNATASASRHAAATGQGSGRAWSRPRVSNAMTNAENSVLTVAATASPAAWNAAANASTAAGTAGTEAADDSIDSTDSTDSVVDALDEHPDLYLWLASNDDALPNPSER